MICETGPATATVLNVTGLRPVTVAVAVWLPAAVPSVHSTAAVPLASVTDDEALKVPDAVDHNTAIPDKFLPWASATLTVRGSGNFVPTSDDACASPETSMTLAGVAAGGPDESPHATVSDTDAQPTTSSQPEDRIST